MQTKLALAGALLLTSFAASGRADRKEAAHWKPAPAPLMTRWAKDVKPNNPRPEYPRPNLVRRNWQNLNGMWEFAFDDGDTGRTAGWASGHSLDQRILVPWTFEASLSGIGRGKEIHEHVWYRRTFSAPDKWRESGQRILLHFGAVDWQSTVWVNGREMGTHRGGYAPFAYDVTDALKADGLQEIVVAVYDPANPKTTGWQPKGKQLGSESIWYTRTTGIWQTVWLEPVSAYHIESVAFEPTLLTTGNTGGLTTRVSMAGVTSVAEGQPTSLTIQVSRNGKHISDGKIEVTDGNALSHSAISLAVPDPQLWTPETPNLYDVTLTVRQNGRVVDEVSTYCAFRTVGVANGRVTLNGKPYFLRGVLDQGFWPDGIYTPPTDAAIKNEVVVTKAMGFNTARKHVKVEDPRWYYYCDKLGLFVTQDMPSSHNLASDEAKTNFVSEWKDIMAATRNYPSVGIWVTFNENWGDPKAFQDEVVTLTRQIDPSRPVIDASGWTQRSLTDITDIHDYSNELSKHATATPARTTWIGEYGGVALPIEGHTWVTGWGYQSVKTPDALVDKYRFLTDQINNAPGLSGFIYTQLTDVEQELNGLLTYDRLPKAPFASLAKINERNTRAVAQPSSSRETGKTARK